MNNAGLIGVGLPLIMSLIKNGMVSSSGSQNLHDGRIRVNFNLNKSFFNHGSNDFSERYFQYSVYGNPIEGDKNYAIGKFSKGITTNYAEVVALRDVSIWCDIKVMIRFHKAIKDSFEETERELGGGPREVGFKRFYDRMNTVLTPKMNKTPFCFIEGYQVPFNNGQFSEELIHSGLDINYPSGIAKFNPRDTNFQPPGFLFSPMIEKGEPVPRSIDLDFIIGAEYALLTNSVATPYPPVYVWAPTVCSVSEVWDFSTGLPREGWSGFERSGPKSMPFTNTYNLYKMIQEGRYDGQFIKYGPGNRELYASEVSRCVVTQKNQKGDPTGKYHGPMRQLIPRKGHQLKPHLFKKFD